MRAGATVDRGDGSTLVVRLHRRRLRRLLWIQAIALLLAVPANIYLASDHTGWDLTYNVL